jgi:hypothetical protein
MRDVRFRSPSIQNRGVIEFSLLKIVRKPKGVNVSRAAFGLLR